jgi:hypothetical protein
MSYELTKKSSNRSMWNTHQIMSFLPLDIYARTFLAVLSIQTFMHFYIHSTCTSCIYDVLSTLAELIL